MTEDDEFNIDFDGGSSVGVTADSLDSSLVDEPSYGSGDGVYHQQGQTLHGDTTRTDTTDDVNIRRLVREPSLSDIRWIYRNTFAKVLIDKPIDDAYKNGFEINNDPSHSVEELLDDYIPSLKMAEKKARRDGMSVLFKQYEEKGNVQPHEPPTQQSVTDYLGANVLTVDDLRKVSESEIENQVPDEYGRQGNGNHYNYECRKSGLVISKKVNDVNWNEPIGVVIDQRRVDEDGHETYQFVHQDRIHVHTWNKEVDGDFHRDNNSLYGELRRNNTTIGEWEGDSELQPIYHLMKDLFKGNWAIMQTVFRYASPFYEVTVPARDAQSEEDFDEARQMFDNLNAKAEGVFPEGYEIELHDMDGGFDPQGYFDPIFDQICAGTEMTRSVLFGTQAGTVSGSSTDRGNYTNGVERLQEGRLERKMDEFIRSVASVSNSIVPNFSLGYKVEWNPLFELDQLDKAENFRVIINAVAQAASQYALEPNEIRELLDELLSDLDYEVDLSEDLDVDDFDLLVDLELAGGSNQHPMNLSGAQEEGGSNSNSTGVEAQGNPMRGQNTVRPPASGTSGTQKAPNSE